MEVLDSGLPTRFLSPAQKKAVLEQANLRVNDNHALILEMIKSDVINEKGIDYPGKLGEMITRLGAPFACYVGLPQQKEVHHSNLNDFFNGNASKIIEVFRAACVTEEGWSSKKIRELANKLGIPIPEVAVVRFTISSGKVFWEFRQGYRSVPAHQIDYHDICVEMPFEDFKVFKDAGKRNSARSKVLLQPVDNYETRYQAFSGERVEFRRNRNPRSEINLTHGNPAICHICMFDVDTFHELGLHMKKRGDHALSKDNPCPRCGENFEFERDHIPAGSFLTKKLNPSLEQRGLGEPLFTREAGVVIAIPKYLHSFVSASYKSLAKTRDALEAQFPSAAVYKDINSYLMFYWESKTHSFDLRVVGAFRYLYRRNVKSSTAVDFSSPHLDHLFMRSLKRFLKRRDVGQKVDVLPPPQGWGHQTFFQNIQRPVYFVKLDERVKNDITLAVMLHDVEKLEEFYRDPNHVRFMINTLARETKLCAYDDLQALLSIGSASAPFPLIFELLKRALEESEESSLKILINICQEQETCLEAIFPDDINGLSLFDIVALYYSSTDDNELLERLFDEDSWEVCWTHEDHLSTTPAMKAAKNSNDEFLKFTLSKRIRNFHALDKETHEIPLYEILNLFYINSQRDHSFLDTQDNNGDTVLHHAVRKGAEGEGCVRVIVAAHPNLSIPNNQGQTVAELAPQSSPEIRELIGLAVRIQEVIDGKGAEEDEDLIEMLIFHDEGVLAKQVLKLGGTLAAIGEKKLAEVFARQLPTFMTNHNTNKLLKLFGILNNHCITDHRERNQDTLIHYAVRRGLVSKIALCIAVLYFNGTDLSLADESDDFQELLDEFHDEAVYIPTHNSITVARIMYYRKQYTSAFKVFLSCKNQERQSALALACELRNREAVKVLLACGAPLETCLYDETDSELRMIAWLIGILDSEADHPKTIDIDMAEVIADENINYVLHFFAALREVYQDWPIGNEINPCETVFELENFQDSHKVMNSEEEDSDDENVDVSISIQNFINRLSVEQKSLVINDILSVRPLRDLLIQLITASRRRQAYCAEFLRLLSPQPAVRHQDEVVALEGPLQRMSLGLGSRHF